MFNDMLFILVRKFTYLIFFLFQFQMDHKIISVSHGKKLKLDNLTLSLPVEDNDWFWAR